MAGWCIRICKIKMKSLGVFGEIIKTRRLEFAKRRVRCGARVCVHLHNCSCKQCYVVVILLLLLLLLLGPAVTPPKALQHSRPFVP
jgi:hypothetical protein